MILKTILIALSVSIFIEVFQLFTLLGAGSSKDLITNTLGAFIGALICKKVYLDSRIKILNISEDEEFFNCLFCYCPHYALGDKCGGNFKYIEEGIKDCSDCLVPHKENGYAYIISKYPEVADLANKNRSEDK